jgi:opacity protein-like surface antigen
MRNSDSAARLDRVVLNRGVAMSVFAVCRSTRAFKSVVVAACLFSAGAAQAQSTDVTYPWSVEFGIGWDNSISGNINSSGIGSINNQATVILKNSYEDVYGTGLHLRFGGGYLIDEVSEVRATFTFQSLDADLTVMGDIGSSRLYGQYQDYQSFGLDLGFRRYMHGQDREFRPYAEGTLGFAFIDETDVQLVAPSINLAGNATDFYDRTAAFTLGGNVGVLWQVAEQVGAFGQIGVRWVSGMSEVDGLAGTGLETINDKSARWTLPFLVGARVRF